MQMGVLKAVQASTVNLSATEADGLTTQYTVLGQITRNSTTEMDTITLREMQTLRARWM